MIQVHTPFDSFTGLDGKPLSNGKVYIGQIGTDPTVVANQIPVFWDEALTIPAAQPLVTNAGYIVRLGAPARVYTATDYSMSVRNASNILVYYLAQFGAVDYATDSDLMAFSGSLQLPDYAALRAYTGDRNAVYVSGAGIAGQFVRATTGTDNNGTIIVSANSVIWQRVYTGGVDVRWWGAKFDTDINGLIGTDDTAAVQACVNYATPLQKTILLPTGMARITSEITMSFFLYGLNMEGQGYQKTKFVYPTLGVGKSLFVCTGYPGANSGAVVRGIGFEGNSGTNAFNLIGANGQIIEDCEFGSNSFACVMSNATVGSFTEYNVLRNCNFLLGCQSAIWYSQTGAGDASFHGSGVEGGVINNSGINSVLVLSSAANPYNAPFSPTIFVHANVTIIAYPTPAGVYRPNFYGTLKLEVQQGRALLCDAPAANAIPYVGQILSQSTNVEFGSLFLCDGVFSALGGSRQTIGARFSITRPLSTNGNTIPQIPYNMMEGCVYVAIRVTGPNYEYRTLHSSWGGTNGGAMVLVATLGQINNPGWGPPVVTLSNTNQIIITNPNYPATGVTAYIDILQIGQSPFTNFVP